MSLGDRVVSVILLGFGSLAAVVSILVFIQRIRLLSQGLTGTGTIVDEAVTSTGPGRHKHATMQSPVVEVVDASNGRPFRFRSSYSSTATTVTLGARVPVRYLPGQPDQAEVDALLPMWFFPVGAAVMAVILLGVWWRL